MGTSNKRLLIQGRHFAKKLVPFIIRFPATRYQTAFLTLHHIWTLARVLPFRQLEDLSRAARANEFFTTCRFPSGKLNLSHINIVRIGHQASTSAESPVFETDLEPIHCRMCFKIVNALRLSR